MEVNYLLSGNELLKLAKHNMLFCVVNVQQGEVNVSIPN